MKRRGNYFHPRCSLLCTLPRQDSIKHMTDVLQSAVFIPSRVHFRSSCRAEYASDDSGRLTHLLLLQIEICAIARNRRNVPRCALPTPRPHTGGRKIAQRPLLWVGLNKLTPFELEAINFISAAAGCLWEGVFQRRGALGANERIALTLTKLWIAVSRVN